MAKLLLSVLPELPVLPEECRLLATELVLSTTVLPSVKLMLSLRPKPMLSTELDTLLPLLLPLPPTATLRPGGCATPGLLRLPVRSPTLSVCPSLSATPSPGRSPGLSAAPGPPLSATPSPTLLLTKCATPALLRSALPSPSRSPSRCRLRSAPRSPVRSAPPSLTRSQGLPALRSLSPLRPLLPTLLLLLLPPLSLLSATELALVLVSVLSATELASVPSVATPLVSVPLPLWLLLVLAMPIK